MALERSRRGLMGSTSEEGATDSWEKVAFVLLCDKKKGTGVDPSSRLLSVSPAVVSGTLTVQYNFLLVLEEYKKGSF